MRQRRDPVPRAKEAWWWLGGILTLGFVVGAIVVAGIALWENIDIRQLAPTLQDPPPPLPYPDLPPASAKAGAGFAAVLFESEPNREYFEDPDFYPSEMARWRESTESAGGSVRVVSDVAGLRSVTAEEVLMLPEAPCLGPDELRAVVRHLGRGGSLVTNWALGVRDRRCAWRGWQTLLDVTGAEAIRELPSRDALYLTVPGGLSTSPGIDPGTRIELRPDPAIALRMPGARVYWSDWALNPAPDDEGAGADVAVSTTTSPDGGRIVWFGVRAGQASTPADSAKLDRLLQNGIRWAGGVPHAAPAPWPGGRQAALIFVLDVEGQEAPVNARDVAAMFAEEGLPISFYAVSQLVQDDEELADVLMSAGEVGSQTVDHAPLAGLTAQDQTVRLRRSFNDVERWTGVGPAGLRPPEDAFDAFTMRAWKAAGGSYILASNEARSAAPEVHETDLGPIVVLPRLIKDDYTVIVRDITLRSRRLADAFLAGTRKVRAIEGLAIVAGHTQIIAAGPRLEAVRAVADSVRAQGGWWIAEAEDVANWWLDRSRVELSWTATGGPPSDQRLEAATGEDLLVSIGSGAEVEGLWVDVVGAEMAQGAIPLVDGRSVDFIEEGWGMRVAVGTVRAGEVKRVSFARIGEARGTSETTDGA